VRKSRGNGPPTGPMKRPRPGRLVQNALALMVSSGGSSVFGVVFWVVVSHRSTAGNLGRATAEIAAMMLLANLSQLSLPTIFDRFLPIAGNRTRRFVGIAYAMSTTVAVIVGIAYVSLGLGRKFIPTAFGWHALFVASVAVWTIFVLQDSVLTSLRATRWVPVENILYSITKIALVPVFFIVSTHQGIFLTWTSPVVVATIAVNWYLFRKRIPEHEASSTPNENFPGIRELISLAFAQYASALLVTISSSIVVLIVIDRLGAVAEAHYYLPALISGGIGILLWNLMTSFIVEASSDPEAFRQHVKIAFRAAIIVLVPSLAIGVAFAPNILQIFGATYAQHGTTLLRMLLLSIPGGAVTAFYSAFAWLDRRVWWLAIRELVTWAVYFTILLLLISHFGILAIGIASLVSSGLQGLFFLPISIRRYRVGARIENRPIEAGTTPLPDS
jgi:O-antigen/teichoic acid export membrane protein